jgi:hypothetical protein
MAGSSDRDDKVVAVGAIILGVCFFGGGIIGGSIDPNLGSLIGLAAGLVVGLLIHGVIETVVPEPAPAKGRRHEPASESWDEMNERFEREARAAYES